MWREEYGTPYHFEFVYRRDSVTLDIEKELFSHSMQKLGLTGFSLDFIEEFSAMFESVLATKDTSSGTLVDRITPNDIKAYNEYELSSLSS